MSVWIRTNDRWNWCPIFYPTELRARIWSSLAETIEYSRQYDLQSRNQENASDARWNMVE